LNHWIRRFGRGDGFHLDRLPFKLLVVLEKPPEHEQAVRRKLAGFVVTVELGIADGYGDNLVMARAAMMVNGATDC
jgi:hypothetical protein